MIQLTSLLVIEFSSSSKNNINKLKYLSFICISHIPEAELTMQFYITKITHLLKFQMRHAEIIAGSINSWFIVIEAEHAIF